MEAVRTTIDAERLATVIDLPESMRHREVEVIVLLQTEEKKKNEDRQALRNLKGCLNEYADPALKELEEGAWERAAVEKYLEIL
jgi:hypothetical protein